MWIRPQHALSHYTEYIDVVYVRKNDFLKLLWGFKSGASTLMFLQTVYLFNSVSIRENLSCSSRAKEKDAFSE